MEKKNLLTLSGIEPRLLGHLIYSRSIDWANPGRNTDITTTVAAATTTITTTTMTTEDCQK
jgi:hypothetical protein